MRPSSMVLFAIVASVGCFSTAPYDGAHQQRVASINARYQAELQRELHRHTTHLTELDHRRASLHALEPLLAVSHDRAARSLAAVDAQAAQLVAIHAGTRRSLELARLRELESSLRQRDAAISVARATRRARVRAAALAATDRHRVVRRPPYLP